MELKHKTLGIILTALSLILIILLFIVKINIDAQEAYLCEITHTSGLDIKTCPAHQSNNSLIFTFVWGLSFLILGSGVFLIFYPQLKKEPSKKIDINKLSEEERIIFNLLKSNDSSMYQHELIKETGFSKVKMTRILDKMESKKIVERKRRGMTNIVVLN